MFSNALYTLQVVLCFLYLCRLDKKRFMSDITLAVFVFSPHQFISSFKHKQENFLCVYIDHLMLLDEMLGKCVISYMNFKVKNSNFNYKRIHL